MIHIGSFSIKTEIFILCVSLLLMSVQLLLCLKVKKTAVRLIPIYPTAGLTAVFVVLGFIFDDWDAVAFFFLALCSAIALFMCGVAWAIWWLICRTKQKCVK
jgi:hypothetical protein